MTAADLLGSAVLDEITAAAKGVPGVGDAIAVPRKGVRAVTPAAPVAPATPQPTGPVAPDATDRPLADLDGGPLHIPDGAPATLQEALRAAAELATDKGTIYVTRGNEDVLQTYPALLAEAERVLAGLRAAGLRPGDPALFVFDDNRGYLTTFWACVLGGFVPTPVAVANTYATPNEVNRKLHNAWELLGRPVLVTDAATAAPLAGVRELWDEPDVRILTVEELATYPPDSDWFPARRDSPVLNLLTSGSTGVPKCVQHTNASVVDRSLSAIQYLGLTEDDVSLIWMPFDHVTVVHYNVRDMFLRCMHVNAKISHFLTDPLLWLDWVDRYRVTTTWAPNFAFAMVNELADQHAARSWDLSSLREIINGAEPVIAGTSHRFLELLAPYGLPADVMVPAFGMSETCTAVTYSRQSRDDRSAGTVAIDPASLNTTIRYVDPAAEGAVVLSKVGRPIPGVQIRVVDEDGSVLPEGSMGEMRIRGRTMMHGYFANDEANRESFDENGWFRTGDSAFVTDGEVVIAGRIKDQIIVRGINYMAHELENVVEQIDNVRVTFVGAVGVREPGADSDQLVIFFVPQDWDPDRLARTTEEMRAVLVRESGLAPDLLIPVTEAEFPKTGSGKVQRAALANELRAGSFADRVAGSGAEEEQPDGWFVRRQWAQLPGAGSADDGAGVHLVFAEEEELTHLPLDGRVVTVRAGEEYGEDAAGRFRVPAADRAELHRLFKAVTAQHGPLATVVFARPLSRAGEPAARLTDATAHLSALLGVLADGEYGHPSVLVLTSGSVHVLDGDRIDLGTCALPGLVRTAVSEAATLTIRQVDLPADRSGWGEALGAELADRGHSGIVAVRQGKRWQPRLLPTDAADADPGLTGPPVIAGGLYLVTGGLGGIAHDVAAYLVAGYGARLLLVGRSAADGEKAERLAELTGLGEVVYEQLDVADTKALAAAVTSAEERWGRPLDGVLHLAGSDPTAQWAESESHTVVNETMATYAEQYSAKVGGTLAIATVLEARQDASLVLFGSVTAEFGGHSFGAYAAANSFLSGFADHWHHERRRPVRHLAWSMWTGIGMNRGQSTAAARSRGFRIIEPAGGLQLFLDTLAMPHHSLIVGLDLTNPAMVEELMPDQLRVSEVVLAYAGDGVDQAALREAIAASVRDCPVPVRLVETPLIPRDATGAADVAQLLLEAVPGKVKRAVEAPATDLERQLAAIWSEALNRPVLGRDESFFELGGNSLRATRLLAMVDQDLGVRVTTQELFENPTVAGMAESVLRHGTGT